MKPSVMQSAKGRTRDRNLLIAELETNLSMLSITISCDGAVKYDGVFTCGISTTDTTKHRIFNLSVDIEEECPLDPRKLSIQEVGEIAREYMRSKGIILSIDKYTLYIVTEQQKDVSKPGAINGKYRANIKRPTIEELIPGVSKTESRSLQRMPHIFFCRNQEILPPMENRDGSSAAVNTSKIHMTATI